ncbi:MAG: hypothetical protein AB8B71_01240 [Paracoccaceae bacterium]
MQAVKSIFLDIADRRESCVGDVVTVVHISPKSAAKGGVTSIRALSCKDREWGRITHGRAKKSGAETGPMHDPRIYSGTAYVRCFLPDGGVEDTGM